MPRLILVLLLVSTFIATAHATEEWSTLLLRQDPALLVEITTDDGAVHTGHPAAAAADSVGLADAPGQSARKTIAESEIVRVRQRRPAAARGWNTGGTIGAVAGGALGLLFSIAAESIGDENTWEDANAPYAAFAVGMAAVGTTVVGGLGALIGSGSETWYDLESREPTSPRNWQLEPQAGLAAADDIGGDMYDDLHLRLFAPRRFGSWFAAGPDLAWMRLGTYRESWDGRSASVHDTWQAGVTTRFTIPAGGLEPYFTLGLGWYQREDSWLGTNWGIGVRAGRATAEVRGHYRSSGIDSEPSNSMTTVAVGWSFDL